MTGGKAFYRPMNRSQFFSKPISLGCELQILKYFMFFLGGWGWGGLFVFNPLHGTRWLGLAGGGAFLPPRGLGLDNTHSEGRLS